MEAHSGAFRSIPVSKRTLFPGGRGVLTLDLPVLSIANALTINKPIGRSGVFIPMQTSKLPCSILWMNKELYKCTV